METAQNYEEQPSTNERSDVVGIFLSKSRLPTADGLPLMSKTAISQHVPVVRNIFSAACTLLLQLPFVICHILICIGHLSYLADSIAGRSFKCREQVTKLQFFFFR